MKRLALAMAALVLALIWFGPLLGTWRTSLTAGMVAHMGVVAIAAPLIALGAPHRWRPGASMPIAVPLVASVLELAAVWGWHAPALRSAAEDSIALTAAEQATFLVVGVFLWLTSLAAPDQPKHVAAGAFALLLTSIHMTLLGALLALSPRPLYGGDAVTCFGLILTAEQDQHFGGVLMLLVGAAVYLASGLVLVGRILAAGPTRAA
jgi:putative membrane protein